MEYDFKEILDIGLEIEFSNIKRDTPNFMENMVKSGVNFKSVHDASAESPEICLGNVPIQFDVNGKNNRFLSILKHKNLETIGGELNSPILNSVEYKESIYKLINFLRNMGESSSTENAKDTRGSIHVHVNVSKDISFKHLIRLLEVGLATEALFYKLGGMGNVNRGVKNSFIYQRPITLPPCVDTGSKVYPIFDYKDLLVSKNKTDFYNRYGDTVFQIRNGNHYVTQRYVGLNFYSIPYRGSLEFRYCNKTLIPEWICAWITLCQNFVNYALTKDKDISFENDYRKLEDNREYPDNEIINIFEKLGVPEDTQITLLDIWHESTMPYFDGQHILTHLPNPTFYSRGTGYYPNPILDAVKQGKVIDVRLLNEEKNHILNSLKYDVNEKLPELDYTLDTTGVKTKLKDTSETDYYYYNAAPNVNIINPFGRENNKAILPLTAEIVQAFQEVDFNIINFNDVDAVKFVNKMISINRTIPFRILKTNWWYTGNTNYKDLYLSFRITKNYKEIECYLEDRKKNIRTEVQYLNSQFIDAYGCYSYNFENIIDETHYNPEDYFANYEEEDEDNNDEDNVFNVVENMDIEEALRQARERLQNLNNGGH